MSKSVEMSFRYKTVDFVSDTIFVLQVISTTKTHLFIFKAMLLLAKNGKVCFNFFIVALPQIITL
jgi:hypothetical protein